MPTPVETMPTGSGWQYAAASGGITDTADVTLAAAPTNGQRNYLCALQIINKHASTGTEVVIKDGSTVLWRGFAEPSTPAALSALPMITVVFPVAIRQPTAATALTAACITNTTATYVNAQGYVGI